MESQKIIEWDMLNKARFFPLCMLGSISLRVFLYPLNLIKTRLQVQTSKEIYQGTFDAAMKIYKQEGVIGFYRGIWVNSLQLSAVILYVTTYEGVRYLLSQQDFPPLFSSMVGGGLGSLASQTLGVPLDIISQHLAVQGLLVHYKDKKLKIPNLINTEDKYRKPIFGNTKDIIQNIYKTEGYKGFFRGYIATLLTSVPQSALWWTLYHFYQDQFIYYLPNHVPLLFIQALSGSFCGATTTIVTNPIDVIRARHQLLRAESLTKTFWIVWIEDGFWIITKGLSARTMQSVFFSTAIIIGYETIKKLSLKEEFKSGVR